MEKLIREILGSTVLEYQMDEDGKIVSGDLEKLKNMLTTYIRDRDGWIIEGGCADVSIKAPDNIKTYDVIEYLLEDAGVKRRITEKSYHTKQYSTIEVKMNNHKYNNGIHTFTLCYE